MVVPLVNVSNPAAFGAEWVSPETGTRFQMANPRGTCTLLFGMKPAGSETWGPASTVTDPDRFGMAGPPKSYSEFVSVVRRFEEGGR